MIRYLAFLYSGKQKTNTIVVSHDKVWDVLVASMSVVGASKTAVVLGGGGRGTHFFMEGVTLACLKLLSGDIVDAHIQV